jgi:hypothetical protein
MIGPPMAEVPFDLGAWVAASCEAQGLPVRVTDPEAVRTVCVLLGATESGPRLGRQPVRGPTRRRSEAPEGSYPLRVEGTDIGTASVDHGVIQHGGDDGVLAAQWEANPLSA